MNIKHKACKATPSDFCMPFQDGIEPGAQQKRNCRTLHGCLGLPGLLLGVEELGMTIRLGCRTSKSRASSKDEVCMIHTSALLALCKSEVLLITPTMFMVCR